MNTRYTNQTVFDLYDSAVDFEETLQFAEQQADTDWEMEFVADMKEKFLQWGGKMYLSNKQYDTIEKIARGEK